jgi:hypothetical protein
VVVEVVVVVMVVAVVVRFVRVYLCFRCRWILGWTGPRERCMPRDDAIAGAVVEAQDPV